MRPAPVFQIFLCHAREDAYLANAIRDKLESSSVRVWIDEYGIQSGQSIHDLISRAISSSSALIAVIRDAALQSPEVREELVRSDERLLPILIIHERGLA